MAMTRMLSIGAVTLALAGGGAAVWHGRAPAQAEARRAAQYHCPMHTTYVSEKPGDCPICGMKLVPMAGGPAAEAPTPAEMGHVRGTPRMRTEAVRTAALAHTVRTVGRVAVDERRIQHVHTKYDGYVERLYADFTGKLVRRGEPLLSIYSPELVATQQEYLLAHAAQARLTASGESPAGAGVDLHAAARQRLRLWDVSGEDVRRLEASGEVRRTLDVRADVDGYVMQKMAYQGMRVTPADTLFDIADLSRLWVLADVYEYAVPSVGLGARAAISVPQLSSREWSGVVTYVSPVVEEKTRTIKVRLEVDNRDRALKPDMFVQVALEADLGHGLVVPEDAVVNSGGRRLVFLDRGEGHYEPREVTLGIKLEQGWQVISGVAEGDPVVRSANFLVDSESNLEAALAVLRARPAAAPRSDAQPE